MAAVFLCLLVCISSKKYVPEHMTALYKSLIFVFIGMAILGRLFSALIAMYVSGGSFVASVMYGGFAFYGGLLGGMIGGLVYCSVKGQSWISFCDVYLSVLPLGQAIGRVGCYFNGCCYGRMHSGLLALPFVVDGVEVYVFPTWFAEAFFCLLLAIYFQIFCKTIKKGLHTAIYLIAYSLFRFVIEFFRGDEIRGVYGFISTSQVVSIIVFIVGIYVFVRYNKKCEHNLFLYQS